MSKNVKVLSKELVNILSSAAKNKIYGSVEVYFEAGNVTQITQRIINKVSGVKKANNQVNYSYKNSDNKHKIKNSTIEMSPLSRSF